MNKIIFILSFFFVISVKAQICFNNGPIISTVNQPEAIKTADFDGDGNLDLAVIGFNGQVGIHKGLGNGSFTAYTTYSSNGGAFGICINDFNNDNKLDVATTSTVTNAVYVFWGNGDATFSATSFSVSLGSSATPMNICSYDFNGDNFDDIAVANSGNNSVSVLMANGVVGTYFSPAVSYTAVNSPWGITVDDFNGDAKMDLATANTSSSFGISVLHGNGDGTFQSVINYNPGSSGNMFCDLTSVDFNGDGKSDIAAANYNMPQINITLNTGVDGSNNTTFGMGPQFNVTGGTSMIVRAVASNDFNGDGKGDIISADYDNFTSNNSYYTLEISNGTGYNFNTNQIFSSAQRAHGLCTGDFTNDNKPDVAIVNSNSNTITLLLNTYAIINLSGNTPICTGSSLTITASGVSTHTWSPSGDTTASITLSPSVTTTYSVSGTGPCGSTSKTFTVVVNPLPTVSATASSTLVCNGSQEILTGTGANTYTWSNNITNGAVFTVTNTATYTVTGTDTNNCVNTATIAVNVVTATAPYICEVSTDSASNYNYNIIYWDNTQYPNADSFLVYRFDVSMGYLKIGVVGKDSSRLMDTARYYGSSGGNNGDPNYGAYKYVLRLKDSCGNLSPQSPYHLTEFMQDQHNGNFNLSPYAIENTQANPITGYALLKDNNLTGNFVQVTSIPTGATSATDPLYNSNASYRVDVLGFNCQSNQRLAPGNNSPLVTRIKSHSNSSNNNRTSSIKAITNNALLNVYPNPANNTLYLTTNSNTAKSIAIFDVLGNVVIKQLVQQTNQVVDISSLSNGVYFVRLGESTARFVKQ